MVDNAAASSALSPPEKSANPYIQSIRASKDAGKTSPGKNGKSSHISTIKSLGLLHDLQDYINSVEALAEDQRRELQRVREEKKDIEKAVFKLDGIGADRPAIVDFQNASISDLPPKLRMVFEENKVMKDKLRKYKHKTQVLESDLLKRNNQIVVMEDTINVLKQQLQACSRTPEEVEREDNLRNLFKEQVRRVQDLEHEVSVLRQKIDVDARLNKQSAAVAGREREQLRHKLVVASANLDDKDKELRAVMLELKQLRRRLSPSKATYFGSLEEEDAQERFNAGADDGGLMHKPPLQPQFPPAPVEVVQLCITINETIPLTIVVSENPLTAQASWAPAPHLLEEHEEEEEQAESVLEPVEEPSFPEPQASEEGAASSLAPPQEGAMRPPVEAPPGTPPAYARAEALPAPAPAVSKPPAAPHAKKPSASPEVHLSQPKAVPYSRTYARAESRQHRKDSSGSGAGTPPAVSSSKASASNSLDGQNAAATSDGTAPSASPQTSVGPESSGETAATRRASGSSQPAGEASLGANTETSEAMGPGLSESSQGPGTTAESSALGPSIEASAVEEAEPSADS